jgi:cytochrome c oxidase subunit 2
MARRALVAMLVVGVAALGLAAAALAAPGGIGPPDPETDSGRAINTVYWVVFAACAVVFVLIESALLLFVFRFRRRGRIGDELEGPQIHGNTRLEVIWTIIPAAALAAIAVFVFVKTPSVLASDTESEDPLRVRVEAHQFYWQYEYENGAISLDTLRIPVDRPVELSLITWDVNHSWWVPALTGKRDAIAGRKNVLRFTPTRIGRYEGACAELCGVQHAVMHTRVEVLSSRAFDNWLDSARGAEARALGKQEWDAVCAKCHGLSGEGDVGPAIAGNGTLMNRQALIRLLSEGQDTAEIPDYMPAVGLGWDGRQYDALVAYIRATPELREPPQTPEGATGGG